MQWGSESDRDCLGLASQRFGNPRERRPCGRALFDTEAVQIAVRADPPVLCCAEGRRLTQPFAEARARHAPSIAELQGQQIRQMRQVNGCDGSWQGAVREGAGRLSGYQLCLLGVSVFLSRARACHACVNSIGIAYLYLLFRSFCLALKQPGQVKMFRNKTKQ